MISELKMKLTGLTAMAAFLLLTHAVTGQIPTDSYDIYSGKSPYELSYLHINCDSGDIYFDGEQVMDNNLGLNLSYVNAWVNRQDFLISDYRLDGEVELG